MAKVALVYEVHIKQPMKRDRIFHLLGQCCRMASLARKNMTAGIVCVLLFSAFGLFAFSFSYLSPLFSSFPPTNNTAREKLIVVVFAMPLEAVVKARRAIAAARGWKRMPLPKQRAIESSDLERPSQRHVLRTAKARCRQLLDTRICR